MNDKPLNLKGFNGFLFFDCQIDYQASNARFGEASMGCFAYPSHILPAKRAFYRVGRAWKLVLDQLVFP